MSTRSRALSPPNKWTTRDGSLKGRLRRKRSLIKLKMAVFRPIPRASVMTAIEVKAGDWRSLRKAKRRSFMKRLIVDHSFSAQCLDRVDKSGPARGHVTGEQCHQSERRDCYGKCPKIERANPEQHTIKSAAGRECADQP